MKNINWRIVEHYNGKFSVRKKVFGKFYYSLDNKNITEYFIGGNFGFLLIGFLFTLFISAIIVISGFVPKFWLILKIIELSVFIIWNSAIIFGNSIEFDSYEKAENFIKNKIKNSAKNTITEFNWDGNNLTVEKKKDGISNN